MRVRNAALALGIGVALCFGTVSGASAVDTNRVRKLPIGTLLKEDLSASGDLIAYTELPGGDLEPWTVGVYEISTGAETIIAQPARSPSIQDGIIVYSRQEPLGYGIYGYDWATKTEFPVAPVVNLGDNHERPVIDGRNVVYMSSTYGDSEVWLANLDTGTRKLVAKNGSYPDIAGDWVVYQKERWVPAPDGINKMITSDISAYRISTGKSYILCNEVHDQRAPSIGANGMVVWSDTRNHATSADDVYGCSVYDRVVFPIATGPRSQREPSVEGNVVAYIDEALPGGYKLVGRDYLSGTVFGIAPASLFGIERMYWSGLSDGVMAWNKTTWIRSGEGTYTTGVYTAEPTQIDQIAGANRYTMAVSASQKSFPKRATGAVIASGENWPDALAGSGLVGVATPLLLTSASSLPACTANELKRLGVTQITILGGVGSVSPWVERQLNMIASANAGVTISANPGAASVRRIAGKDRIDTASLIAKKIAASPEWDGTVIVATSATFADALGASPMAAAAGLPVVLSGKFRLANGVLAHLREMGAKRAIIVGGPASVPEHAVTQLAAIVGPDNVVRLSGRDRYTTAIAVSRFAISEYGLKWDGLGIASGTAFADAMVGGVMKGKQGSVMLLTPGTVLSPATAATLKSVRRTVKRTSYIGGTGTLTKPVRGQVRAILH